MRCLIKSGIVKGRGDCFEISATPPNEKKINLYNNSIDVRPQENAAIGEQKGHTMSIQSVIAREMKAKRRMAEKELKRRVTEELSGRFRMREKDFENVLKGMIESLFLERDGKDTDYLVYIP
jgi:hypothetical protein